MPGIYLHIPFCKQACHYCNFHFSTTLRLKGDLLAALHREIRLQAGYLKGAPLDTVYFGGGTPSLLSAAEINAIWKTLTDIHVIREDAEVTLEANPDDLSEPYVRALRDTPVNRLSIGIQSFSEEDLRFMNRAHNAGEARQSIENALAAGFKNLTIDLIYGSPTTSDAQWAENLEAIFRYGIPHISCYCLTVEEGTALSHFVKHGKASAVDEECAARQLEYLMQQMEANGYEQYEISNFALPGWYARHNSSYWLGDPYLGIGPSAHSFDGASRQWNVANNAKYIKALEEGLIPFEREILSASDRYNEYIMVSLRTSWGCQLDKIKGLGEDFLLHFLRSTPVYLAEGLMDHQRGRYFLTPRGRLLADRIASELFL